MTPACLTSLAALSARLGRDPMLVQGGGGNVSIKDGDVLWVKASGMWLAAAEREAIFVPVDLTGVRCGIADDHADAVFAHVLPGHSLRPSIETTLHALLPWPVVVHLHSVNVLAVAVRRDGESLAAVALRGLDWRWLSYCRPGVPLTRAVASLGGQPGAVIILANHGVVIGAESCEAVAALIADVEDRLQAPARTAPEPDMAWLAAAMRAGGWQLPRAAHVHGLATDPISMDHACAGPLSPDQVIFLGPEIGIYPNVGRSQVCLAPGRGVLVRADTTAGQDEMLACLSLLVQRLVPDAPLAALSAEEAEGLGNWDAEKYRKSLDARRG